ncbi:MAG: MFS transporter [Desulfobacteraceae bacterium]|jgi:MFS family permease
MERASIAADNSNRRSETANKRAYWSKAAPVLFLGILMMYFYSGLQNDHLNALTEHYRGLGWNVTTITNPVTWGAFVVIPATVLVGALMIRFGVVPIVVPSIAILALSTIGLAFAGTNLFLYSISLFLVRLFVLPLQMGAFMLCTNWFIELRGRALGFITIGCPLFTATGIVGLTASIGAFGFTTAYAMVGGILFGLALLVGLLVKSTPEQCGLFPDGADASALSSSGDIQSLSFKEVILNSGSWLLIISFGLLQFCIVAIMAFYVPRLAAVGTEPKVFLLWLTISAFLGMPISLILGIIDDKLGTVIASLVLCGLFVLAIASLLVMKANSVPLIFAAAIGIAGITGGTPNLHPSITTYVWGREKYQAANRWIMAIQAIMMAFSIYFMSVILDTTGSLDLAYKIMLGLVAVAAVCLLIIGRKPDFDRGRAVDAP